MAEVSNDNNSFSVVLYVDGNEASREASKALIDGGVNIVQYGIETAGETVLIAPTLIAKEGTFRGQEGVQAYLGWFVRDPEYNRRYR